MDGSSGALLLSADGSQGTVTCPQCGGENVLPTGTALLLCTFCGASVWVDRSQVVIHYRVPRLLDAKQAQEALRRWMAGNQTVKDLDRLAVLGAVEASSFPMWLFRFRSAQGEAVLVEPAAATPIGDIADLELPAGKLEPFGGGEPGVAETPVGVPLETARQWLAQRAQSAGDLAEQALVNVPLWRCEYQFEGKSYVALVEGATGRTFTAVYPAKAETPYFAVAALGLLLFLAEGFALKNPIFKGIAYLLTAVPVFAAAYWVTRKV